MYKANQQESDTYKKKIGKMFFLNFMEKSWYMFKLGSGFWDSLSIIFAFDI